MGTTGGGLWKTEDYGSSWNNISDGFFKTGTVGSVSVSESDPNVVIVGMGEHAARGVMTSMGDGIYASLDAGKTWINRGLKKLVAVFKCLSLSYNLYCLQDHDGIGLVYLTRDGGKTWKNITPKGLPETIINAIDISPHDKETVYIATTRYKFNDKSPGLYKSTNYGESWKEITGNIPYGAYTRVVRANSNIVYANIEAKGEKGGVYRSDNAGEKWIQVNKDRITIARSWYYMEIFADPINENIVYVLNAPALKSIDKGKTFKKISYSTWRQS